ncbi:signaling lymphocytic activation molecule isoform X1 [Chionomys nivalis]|uniref:signaling lymphocytic activation molecule isoform X1 n=1 Tax=Chionomys nivalis TaxID=269649 RepID=UPI002594AA9A|nr:signaling lymphocytic activation molecule isoform X1 [Chionomys nivalis]
MKPNRSLSLGILLLLPLAFELSYGTGGGLINCPVIIQQLGNDTTWLPLMKERVNKSIRILVTKATTMSLESKITKKIVSFNVDKKGYYLEHLENGYQFQWENLSLGILGNRRESEGWYIVSLEENVQVQQFCIQLKLYEQVSTPEIKVLNKTQENGNGTCSLTVVCTVKKGDHVTYSWSGEAGKHLLSLANHSHLLNISLSSQDHDNIYNCTASNPVSSRSQSFDLSQECRRESSDTSSWITHTAGSLGFVLLLLIVLVPIAVILLKRQGERSHCQAQVEEKGLTIYAQVQKSGPPEKKFNDSLTGQSPCTTIYVAATEPVPEPVQESNPTTVYASVTLPES